MTLQFYVCQRWSTESWWTTWLQSVILNANKTIEAIVDLYFVMCCPSSITTNSLKKLATLIKKASSVLETPVEFLAMILQSRIE